MWTYTLQEIKHWLVVNVPGNDLSKGRVIAAYRGAGKYVFECKISIFEIQWRFRMIVNDQRFSVSNWIILFVWQVHQLAQVFIDS